MRYVAYIAAALLMSVAVGNAKDVSPLSDAQIRVHLIKASQDGYSGSCPCPDNRDNAGRRCGKRSAYSRPGGEEPLCYPKDVTADMIVEYRKDSRR